MIVWIVAISIITITLYFYLSPPDVDQYFTQHQASFTATRQPHETALARSTVNPHGAPLIGSKLEFKLSDLWQADWSVTLVKGPVITSSQVSIANLVTEYSLSIRALSVNGSKVLCALPESPQTLALLFACTLQGLTPYFVLPSQLQEAIKALHPGSIVIDSHTTLKDIDLGDAIPVSLDGGSDEVMPLTSFKGGSPPPSPRPSDIAFGIYNDKLFSFTHKTVGRAIASQLASLGKGERWSSKDKVLNFSLYPTFFSLIMSFACISSRANLVYLDHAFADPYTVVEEVKPTIIVTDDLSLRSLIRATDDFRLLGFFALQSRYLFLQKGRLLGPIFSQFKSVRLVYSTAVLNERHGALTSNETRTARALLGCQLIHVLCDPVPICQTTFGDYRVAAKKINFGPPVPGIEIKAHITEKDPKYGTLSYYHDGSWIDSDIEGYLLSDGCFYIKEPEPDQVDIYSEHIPAM